jgi:ribonuclease VapC
VIVVDTSAIVAIVTSEPGFEDVARRLFADEKRVVSPLSVVEATMVLSRVSPNPNAVVAEHLKKAGISLCPVDLSQTEWAQAAFLAYGKGRHPAKLNLGDCFSYAVAKALDAKLLFVGEDFSRTDIKQA